MKKMSKKRLVAVPAKKPAPTPVPPLSTTPAPTPELTPEATPAAAIAALENALAAVRELSAQRLRAKLSVSRLMGVARELKELLKVMSVYGV